MSALTRAKLGALILLVLLTGCTGDPPEPAGERLDATVVEFDTDVHTPAGTYAMDDAPIDARVAAGWRATEPRVYGEPDEPSHEDDPEIADRPGRTYVLATGGTGCGLREDAELWRDGDDLAVRFTGGSDGPDECNRHYTALAQFEVDSAALAGVRTLYDKPLLDGAGPGTRTGFVRLGPLRQGSSKLGPVELTGNAARTLTAALARAGAGDPEQARAALLRTPAAGNRAFAFVVSGCQETGASLFVSRTYLAVLLTGGNGTVCDAPAYFLVRYDLPARLVPPAAKPI